MTPEYLVSFDTAKILKKAGFPQDIMLTRFYNERGQDWHFCDGNWQLGCARPTQAHAMTWLREQGLFVELYYGARAGLFHASVLDMASGEYIAAEQTSKEYRDAINDAIADGCQHIIKLKINQITKS